MRLFIALEASKGIREELSLIQERLRKTGADVKWVEPENIHLSLKFLGETEEKQLKTISDSLAASAAGLRPFKLNITSIGAFPKPNSPRVIWAGTEREPEEIKQIVQNLQDLTQMLGLPPENKPFACHITLGRVKSPFRLDKLVDELKKLTPRLDKPLEFEVNKIVLFKSTLTPKGPLYEALKEVILKTD